MKQERRRGTGNRDIGNSRPVNRGILFDEEG